MYAKSYIDMVNKMPEVLGWLYDRLDKPFGNDRLRLAFSKLNTRPFVKMLEQERPDIAVCTHFLPEEIIAWLKTEGRLTCPLAVVVTDFDVHAMWLSRQRGALLRGDGGDAGAHGGAGDAGRADHRDRASRSTRCSRSAKDKRRCGASTGWSRIGRRSCCRPGGFGVGPIEHLMTSAAEDAAPGAGDRGLRPQRRSSKARLESAGERRCRRSAAVRVQPIGYTTEMDEYMAASDILLGKPGGLTTSEALARGLVFVIVNPIPGQEERNSDHLLEEGVAIRCNNLPALAYKIDRLLDDPARFAAMQAQAKAMGRAESATVTS